MLILKTRLFGAQQKPRGTTYMLKGAMKMAPFWPALWLSLNTNILFNLTGSVGNRGVGSIRPKPDNPINKNQMSENY